MPMVTKLDRVVTYLEGVLLIKSHDSFNQVVLWDHIKNIKNVIPPLLQCLWSPNEAEWFYTMRSFFPQNLFDSVVLRGYVAN